MQDKVEERTLNTEEANNGEENDARNQVAQLLDDQSQSEAGTLQTKEEVFDKVVTSIPPEPMVVELKDKDDGLHFDVDVGAASHQ